MLLHITHLGGPVVTTERILDMPVSSICWEAFITAVHGACVNRHGHLRHSVLLDKHHPRSQGVGHSIVFDHGALQLLLPRTVGYNNAPNLVLQNAG